MVAELGLLTELTTVLRPPEGALEEEEEEDRPPSTESSSSKFLSAPDREGKERGRRLKQTSHQLIHSESMIHLSGATSHSCILQSHSLPACAKPPLSALDFLPAHSPPDANPPWRPCAHSQRHLPGVSAQRQVSARGR